MIITRKAPDVPIDNLRPPSGPPKVALLFLTDTDHHHPILWKRFLAASPPDHFTIYAHPSCVSAATTTPSKAFRKLPCPPHAIPKSSFLYGHTLPDYRRVPTKWGKLVLAYYALLKEAYYDPDEPNNQRFVYVSETCVPLVHPDRLYSELTADLRVTYMDRADNPKEDHDRYQANGNRQVQRALKAAGIRSSDFFKHSGWFCPCRADAKRLLACKPAFDALNRV